MIKSSPSLSPPISSSPGDPIAKPAIDRMVGASADLETHEHEDPRDATRRGTNGPLQRMVGASADLETHEHEDPRDATRGGVNGAALAGQRMVGASADLETHEHEDPRDATRGGVNGPALPGQRGRESPLSIDLTGELCPFTFVRTKLALEDMAIGELLRVIVDHEPATRNIPRSATEWGQDVIGVTRLTPHTWAIDLRKRVR